MFPSIANSFEKNTLPFNKEKIFTSPTHTPQKNIHFSSELELVESFSNVFLSNFVGTNYHFLKEFDCSNGIADLVLFQSKKNWLKHLSIGNIPPRWAYTLVNLPYRKNFNLFDFMSVTRVSKTTALSVLKSFSKAGFCTQHNSNKNIWTKVKQPRAPISKIIAVEAKLRNWSRALSQACRYLDYANESWVLLDQASLKAALAHIDRFKHFNIGLASINTEKELTIYNQPSLSSPKSAISFWQANAKITKDYLILNNFYNND